MSSRGGLRPGVVALLLGAGVLLLALLSMLWPRAGPTHGLPWQVEARNGGWRVFGIDVPGSRLAAIERELSGNLALALVERRGRELALEAYVERFDAGGVNGRLVLAFDVDAQTLQGWRERSTRQQRAAADTVRHELSAADREAARGAALARLVFIVPSVLADEVLLQRFGAPARQQALPERGRRWDYPALGLVVLLPDKGATVLEYGPAASGGAPGGLPGVEIRTAPPS